MITLGIILVLVGLLLLVFSFLIARGHLSLIHDYHWDNVKEEDKKIFGISVGISLSIFGLGLLAGGILAFILGDNYPIGLLLAIEFGSMFVSVSALCVVIKKYNGHIM